MYDGGSPEAPLLELFTGAQLPSAVPSSSGPDVYIAFTTNDNVQAVGFYLAFRCFASLSSVGIHPIWPQIWRSAVSYTV